MSRLPLLIGVSGKRTFDAKNLANDEAIADVVRKRFEWIFGRLDHDFRHTPKILLTGAAFGADLIAAKAALQRRTEQYADWAVVALLPFEREEFRKDFDQGPNDPSGAEWAKRFARHKDDFDDLMRAADEDEKNQAPAPRVIVRELPKLFVAPAVAGEDDPDALTVQQLARPSNALRDEHYEQVGQFIAESAMIMIAVTRPDEKACTKHATGGTNRIVAYRRAGLDDAGARVAAKSRILRRTIREPIAPPVRFAWLINPYDKSFEPTDYAVTPLRPFLTAASAESYQQATFKGAHANRARDLATSRLLAKRLDRFNAQTGTGGGIVADISPLTPATLVREAERVAEIISKRQGMTNRASRRCFGVMAALFVLAVFTFETFVKFFEHSPFMLLGYLGILGLIGVVVWFAQKKSWQADSEDYRAVAEMLRVQQAWWSAAIDERVDREHLQGASPDLIAVRYAGTAIIAWLLMRCGWIIPQRADWSAVRGSESKARRIALSHRPWMVRILRARANRLGRRRKYPPKDWIGSQLSYFACKTPNREDIVRISEAASWTLFIASAFLALIVFGLLYEASLHDHHAYDRLSALSIWPNQFVVGWFSSYLSPVAWILLAGVVIGIRIVLSSVKRSKAILFSFATGAITAFLLSLVLISAAANLRALLECYEVRLEVAEVAERSMIILLVGLSAIAGALRYLTERLNIEAEAHEYRDAHVRFDRAEHVLAELGPNTNQDKENQKRARTIVFELGRLALAENEAWLKSRRERPLTPVVG